VREADGRGQSSCPCKATANRSARQDVAFVSDRFGPSYGLGCDRAGIGDGDDCLGRLIYAGGREISPERLEKRAAFSTAHLEPAQMARDVCCFVDSASSRLLAASGELAIPRMFRNDPVRRTVSDEENHTIELLAEKRLL